jgi:hypothetical protein
VSPSESDLRAALRAGEGDGLDPDSVLTAARAARHQRRVRIASAAGAVVLVGAVAGGVGIANLRSPGQPTAANHPTGATSTAASGSQNLLGGSSSAADVPGPVGAALATLTCPATPTRYLLPGGGGTGQFGGTSALFAQPVAAIKVCVYPAGTGTPARSFVLTGADAQSLANRLDAGPTAPLSCPMIKSTPQEQTTYEALAVTSSGTKLPAVTVVGGRITNGTAVRFGCAAPPTLSRLVPPTR